MVGFVGECDDESCYVCSATLTGINAQGKPFRDTVNFRVSEKVEVDMQHNAGPSIPVPRSSSCTLKVEVFDLAYGGEGAEPLLGYGICS